MARYLLQLSLMALAVLYAWARGGSPERAAATAIASMYILDPAYHALWGNVEVYGELNVGHLVIDGLVLAILAWIALRANRIWPLWLVSVQIIAVIGHLLRWMSTEIDPLVYALFTRFPSYLQIALLFVGTALYQGRLRVDNNYPSWRGS